MRWENLSLDREDGAKLPGFRDPARVRTFDAPEALGTRFYEVGARSILNRVPERSRMPFRWTINPYRGCSHACTYCIDGATRIWLADGRSKPMAEVGAGDRIVGTQGIGRHRHYVESEVLDHWPTGPRPAYRMTLADGTELVASADHRFLSDRGWKHVLDSQLPGPARPHLALGDRLLGPGTTAPGRAAVSGRRSVAGMAAELAGDLEVVAIEPVGERELWDMTTTTGDFLAGGVIAHNCFARPTHTYLDFDAGRDFEREIVVKTNAPERLRAELAKPSWKREHVALGTNTDPYQWVEGRYRLMVGIWEAMRDFANPCSVLTKSPLLLRDLDLMKEIAARTEFTANLSIPTLDERAWRETEPHSPNPRKRLEAVAALNEAGIPTGILIAPLMPGINDSPAQVEEILRLATEAGATNVGGIGLHLRGETRNVFFEWLIEVRPDLLDMYERLYSGGAYLPKPERERLAKLARGRHPPRRFLRERERAKPVEAVTAAGKRQRGAATPPSDQSALF